MRKKTLSINNIKEKMIERTLCSYENIEVDKSLIMAFSIKKCVGAYIVRWDEYSKHEIFHNLEKAIKFYNSL